MSDAWYMDIGVEASTEVISSQQYYALIFQAARDYYYGDRFGLSSPPRKNCDLCPQMKIAANLNNDGGITGSSHAATYQFIGGITPDIQMREWNMSSDWVYAVTTHELAHWSHYNMDRDAFNVLAQDAYLNFLSGNDPSAEAVIESWPNGVEWMFAQERYENKFGIAGYEYDNNLQDQRIAPFNTRDNHLIYTSIVVDMIDDCNQRASTCFTTVLPPTALNEFPHDKVEYYTILQIEESLRGARSWDEWRDNMRSISNPTSIFIDSLYANWY